MMRFFEEVDKGFIWSPELGMGRYPVPADRPYDASYFSRYRELANTELGRKLTAARVDLVTRYHNGMLVDVGIGAGQFVEQRSKFYGFDVNPKGIEWLKLRGRWANLYASKFPALTFWDSLEHIDRPDQAIAQAEKWVFVSVPIFESAEHVICSRHYRKDEHIWYWTHTGLVRWFEDNGFRMVEHNNVESELGRDGIGSYAFVRI